MDKLARLTQQVRTWNMMGYSLLPELELVIIASRPDLPHAMAIITQFEGAEVSLASDPSGEEQAYRLFVLREKVHGRAHLLMGLGDNEIKDSEFR